MFRFTLLILCSLCGTLAVAQTTDRPQTYISGNAALTNNGISIVPSFSLEQPAALVNMSLERGRFSFDPEIAFSLEEWRAWYQIYWLRYRPVVGEKFSLRTGAHFGLNFARILDSQNEETIKAERYLAGELAPEYKVGEHLKVGLLYMIAQGYDIGTSCVQHFMGVNANLSQIRLSNTLSLEVSPQVFFLHTFLQEQGVYASSAFKLTKARVPLLGFFGG